MFEAVNLKKFCGDVWTTTGCDRHQGIEKTFFTSLAQIYSLQLHLLPPGAQETPNNKFVAQQQLCIMLSCHGLRARGRGCCRARGIQMICVTCIHSKLYFTVTCRWGSRICAGILGKIETAELYHLYTHYTLY